MTSGYPGILGCQSVLCRPGGFLFLFLGAGCGAGCRVGAGPVFRCDENINIKINKKVP